MKRHWRSIAAAGLLTSCAAGIAAAEEHARAVPDPAEAAYRARAPEWRASAPEGHCTLRIHVDDKANVMLRGSQVIVTTIRGKRSYDEGSYCTQPLPAHPVRNFRVTAENGRGHITDVHSPQQANEFTGTVSISDPARAGDTYVLDVAWNDAAVEPPAPQPIAAGEPYPAYDEARACQERVRDEFLARNRESASLEFTELPLREALGPERERISGRAWATNRVETRAIQYECTVSDRTSRVLASNYELLPGRDRLR